jgi:hypothetical protein
MTLIHIPYKSSQNPSKIRSQWSAVSYLPCGVIENPAHQWSGVSLTPLTWIRGPKSCLEKRPRGRKSRDRVHLSNRFPASIILGESNPAFGRIPDIKKGLISGAFLISIQLKYSINMSTIYLCFQVLRLNSVIQNYEQETIWQKTSLFRKTYKCLSLASDQKYF